VPEGVPSYITCGDDDARAYAGRAPRTLAGVHALFVNRSEALGLTGEQSVDDAAARLAELVEIVVVTLGAEGAISVSGGERWSAAADPVEHPVDTTGAGDLLVAAYIWADLRGADPADRLRWAVLYASLAIGTATGIGGAVNEAELLAAGAARGIPAPSQS
jgi:ribokinase